MVSVGRTSTFQTIKEERFDVHLVDGGTVYKPEAHDKGARGRSKALPPSSRKRRPKVGAKIYLLTTVPKTTATVRVGVNSK